jgi:hypothetical protein
MIRDNLPSQMWYKPDVHYLVTTRTLYIGTLAFLCDPGFPASQRGPSWSFPMINDISNALLRSKPILGPRG